MKITRYRPMQDKGCLVAFFSLEFVMRFGPNMEYVAPFAINDMKFFNKNGQQWVSPPDREYQTPEGEKKYAPYCGIFDKERNQEFQKLVLDALTQHLRQNQPGGQQNALQSNVNGQKNDCIQYPHVYNPTSQPKTNVSQIEKPSQNQEEIPF